MRSISSNAPTYAKRIATSYETWQLMTRSFDSRADMLLRAWRSERLATLYRRIGIIE
jgi:hypothetical protein